MARRTTETHHKKRLLRSGQILLNLKVAALSATFFFFTPLGCEEDGRTSTAGKVNQDDVPEGVEGVQYDFGVVAVATQPRMIIRVARPIADLGVERIAKSCSCIGARVVEEDSKSIGFEIGFGSIQFGKNSGIASIYWADSSQSVIRVVATGRDEITVIPSRVTCSVDGYLSALEVVVLSPGTEQPAVPFDSVLIGSRCVPIQAFTIDWKPIELEPASTLASQEPAAALAAPPALDRSLAAWRVKAILNSTELPIDMSSCVAPRLLASTRVVCVLDNSGVQR